MNGIAQVEDSSAITAFIAQVAQAEFTAKNDSHKCACHHLSYCVRSGYCAARVHDVVLPVSGLYNKDCTLLIPTAGYSTERRLTPGYLRSDSREIAVGHP